MLVVSCHNNYNVAKLHIFFIMVVLLRKRNFNIHPVLFSNIPLNIFLTPAKSIDFRNGGTRILKSYDRLETGQ